MLQLKRKFQLTEIKKRPEKIGFRVVLSLNLLLDYFSFFFTATSWKASIISPTYRSL